MIFLAANVSCHRCLRRAEITVEVNVDRSRPVLRVVGLPTGWETVRIPGTGERDHECPECAARRQL